MVAAAPGWSEAVVDVIVNNHDYGEFVCAAVDSALAQTHPHVNVIVVDDGSTDGSPELLEAYRGRVELVLKRNGGQASALNAGFARSRGQIVIFLDADDMLLPEAAAIAADAFGACPAAVKVQYRMEVIDRTGGRTGSIKPLPHLPLPQGDVSRLELAAPFDLVWMATSGNAFRADALARIMPIPEIEFAACPDWYLVHLTPLLGPVVSRSEVGALYRVHGRNAYERPTSALDLAQVRQSVVYAASTKQAIDGLAAQLRLERPSRRSLSLADIANRLVSRRLEPALHPIRGDRTLRLLADGCAAVVRRGDLPVALKAAAFVWLALVAFTPRPAVRRLALVFLFPERRPWLNRALDELQRSSRGQ